MTVTSVYPVLMSADVPATAAFYREHLGFTTTFATDWYVSLRHDTGELAVLDPDHATIPAGYRGRAAAGVIVNIEVDNAAALWHRLVVAGPLTAALALRDETFGQRHFIVEGPDGVLIDVIEPIEPGPEFTAAFAQAEA